MSQHRYIPNAEQDVKEMLSVIGVESIDRLFDSIPGEVKLKRPLDIPGPWSEIESRRWFRELASRNKSAVDHLSFLGGGAYAHYQPACVDQLLLRADFLHTLSAGGLAGNAAIDLRISDAPMSADRIGRGQRLSLRRIDRVV
jgi:glycine cleavage system pyridoxal-binding protein P